MCQSCPSIYEATEREGVVNEGPSPLTRPHQSVSESCAELVPGDLPITIKPLVENQLQVLETGGLSVCVCVCVCVCVWVGVCMCGCVRGWGDGLFSAQQ